MIKIGDAVMIGEMSCKVIDIGEDEQGVTWYTCTPKDFYFPREFTIDKLVKV